MIGFLRGVVYAYGAEYVLLDVNGVGYRISFYHPEALSPGREMTIFTYQNVREDAITLFGFLSLEEYELFMKLISVKGIGPKTACGILARASVNDILKAIELGDAAFMKKMPGIGAKAASQIILDLKGKLVPVGNNKTENDQQTEEVIAALKSLGYKQSEIDAVLPKVKAEGLDLSGSIRRALNLLAK